MKPWSVKLMAGMEVEPLMWSSSRGYTLMDVSQERPYTVRYDGHRQPGHPGQP
jgi:hypothetical protein